MELTDVGRRALLRGGLALGAGALVGCGGDDWTSTPTGRLRIGTGNVGGVFVRYGGALGTVLRRRLPGLRVETRRTNASISNLRLVAAGDLDLGLTLGDAAADAVLGRSEFPRPLDVVALARLYDSFLQLVVPAAGPVRTPADLRGRRVALGAVDSGTRVLATRVLSAAGVATADVVAIDGTLEEATGALRRDEIDALFFVSGLPNDAIVDLARAVPVRLVDLGAQVAPLVRAHGPEYVTASVPPSTYGLSRPVTTVSVKNYLVARPDLSERTAYAVTRLMFTERATVERLAPEVPQPQEGSAIFTSPVDLHPGAVRWFREAAR